MGFETEELPLILFLDMDWVGLGVGSTIGDLDVDWVIFELDVEGVEGLLLGKVEGVPLLLSGAVLFDLGVVDCSSDAIDLDIA